MFAELFNYLGNYFFINKKTYKYTHKLPTYEHINVTFANSTLTCEYTGRYIVGQYIYVFNSLVNDNVYKITAVADGVITIEGEFLAEESKVFIFPLRVPKAIVTIEGEINSFITTSNTTRNVKSERIDDYQITYATPADGTTSWQQHFSRQLAPYKKVTDELERFKLLTSNC